MTLKKLNKKQLIKYSTLLLTGVIIGYSISQMSSNKENNTTSTQPTENNKSQLWTCSMHPQIRKNKPGKCPICGMDLISLNTEENSTSDIHKIQMSESALKIAEVQTTRVQKSIPVKEIYLPGKVKADEQKIAVITSRFSGRIEKLYVNFTGQEVQKSEKLATIYSPDLIAAQKELLEALKYKSTNPEYYKAARNKLKLWSLTDAQIDLIEQNGEPENYFEIYAPLSGTVLKRNVSLGNYVKEGDVLFEIADLSKVWVLFDAYESDLPWIHTGSDIQFEIQSLPGEIFNSKITFIDPVVNPDTRVASVRTEISNTNNKLKPEMFARGIIKANLPFTKNALIVPKSAVLWTGKKSIVYVKDTTATHPVFEYREIILGEDAGNFYVVKEGLQEGEEIVSNGVFKIDAAAQLQGKKSMMNTEGGKVSLGHQHGAEPHSSEPNLSESEHTQHNKKASYPIPKIFEQSLKKLIEQYILIKDGLTKDDVQSSKSALKSFEAQFVKMDMNLLKGEAHMSWMSIESNIKNSVEQMKKSTTIHDSRKSFLALSQTMVDIMETFQIQLDKTIYLEFCPMANDNKGGYWLSFDKEIKNPYFGSKMLKCGSVKKQFKP